MDINGGPEGREVRRWTVFQDNNDAQASEPLGRPQGLRLRPDRACRFASRHRSGSAPTTCGTSPGGLAEVLRYFTAAYLDGLVCS
jgi:hypothetical protein